VDECKPLLRGRGRLVRPPGNGAHPAPEAGDQGEAVQVNPMKPKLKTPGSERLKLKCDHPLSRFAFKFNLRRYTKEHFTTTSYQVLPAGVAALRWVQVETLETRVESAAPVPAVKSKI